MLGCFASKTVPGAEKWPWDGLPLGLETAPPVGRALRWLGRGRKNAGKLLLWSFRRGTGRLNATQPGNSLQQGLHTWIGC
jgi:hypothetical protein